MSVFLLFFLMGADFVFLAAYQSPDILAVFPQNDGGKEAGNRRGDDSVWHLVGAEGLLRRDIVMKDTELPVKEEKGTNRIHYRKRDGRKRDIFRDKHNGKKQCRAHHKETPVEQTNHRRTDRHALAPAKTEIAGVNMPDEAEEARDDLKEISILRKNCGIHAAENRPHNQIGDNHLHKIEHKREHAVGSAVSSHHIRRAGIAAARLADIVLLEHTAHYNGTVQTAD